jgi:hypothetical protein
MRNADMYGAYSDGELKKYLHTTSYRITQAETKISAPAMYPHTLLNFFSTMGKRILSTIRPPAKAIPRKNAVLPYAGSLMTDVPTYL